MASIVIPAHNEAMVIGRTLESLADGNLHEGIRVLVACNGCTDDTIQIANSFADRLPIEVIDLPVASKQAALNGADEHLGDSEDAFPRIYLDADIAAPSSAINAVVDALSETNLLAARPPLEYRTASADRLVQAYYRARSRTPGVLRSLWGAGIYAVSRAGRSRWGEFPLQAPDDLFVDSRFTDDEKAVLDCAPVPVEVPRTSKALLKTLQRVHRPSQDVVEEAHDAPSSSGGTLVQLLKGNRRAPLDAATYVGFSVGARVANLVQQRKGHSGASWERDETSR
ncbi:glycosyltransferase [Luteococcus sp. Sow4_B9]|uniref:glycosyltransferase n=1 Tax=Luteococcus sp. Sow4_B9 TaxID=3438792 RepID=UPI003F958B9C